MTLEVYTYEQFMRKYLPNYYAKQQEERKEKIIFEIGGAEGLEKYHIKKAVDEIFKKVKLKIGREKAT